MRREDITVARCTVQRLMQRLGLKGVIRGKTVRTTVSDPKAPCPLDHVNREFSADRPNALWVSDFTLIPSANCMLAIPGASLSASLNCRLGGVR